MEPRPKSNTDSVPFLGSGHTRNRLNLHSMSISELISELRDSFRKSDFDRVEETLVAREAMLKAEIEEKKREIVLLNENFKLDKLEKIRVEMELKRVKEEKFKDGDGVGEKRKKDGVGGSGNNFDRVEETLMVTREAMLTAAIKEKVNEIELLKENNQFKSWGNLNFEIDVKMVRGERCAKDTMNVKENGNGLGASDTELRKSLGTIQENLATRPVKPIGATRGKDFDQVKETLGAREGIEEKMRQIRLLPENNQFKSLGKLNSMVESKMVRGERCGEELVKDGENGNGFGLGDAKFSKAVMGNERYKLEELKGNGVRDGEAHAFVEHEGEKVKVLAENKRLAGEPSKKDGPENVHKSSPPAVPKNLATRLTKPIGILKRNFASPEFVTKMNILDGLDSDSSSSSSSSSSGEFDMDISSLVSFKSNKKMKTNVSHSSNELLTKFNKGK